MSSVSTEALIALVGSLISNVGLGLKVYFDWKKAQRDTTSQVKTDKKTQAETDSLVQQLYEKALVDLKSWSDQNQAEAEKKLAQVREDFAAQMKKKDAALEALGQKVIALEKEVADGNRIKSILLSRQRKLIDGAVVLIEQLRCMGEEPKFTIPPDWEQEWKG